MRGGTSGGRAHRLSCSERPEWATNSAAYPPQGVPALLIGMSTRGGLVKSSVHYALVDSGALTAPDNARHRGSIFARRGPTVRNGT